ncbi:MAG: hypothetical protein WDM76_05000 [Limisphaerales bacterium]
MQLAANIEKLVEPFLGGDDPVFGFHCDLTLPDFFDGHAFKQLRQQSDAIQSGLILIVGCGARLIADGDVFVYADLSRWEAQNRFRRNESAISARKTGWNRQVFNTSARFL